MEDQPIVFAYYKDDVFKGFRADTFNTISEEYPKIYNYSKEQVDIVKTNVQQGCNKVGTGFAKLLKDKMLVSTSGNSVDGDELVEHLSKTEKTFQEWREFELRVLPFVSREEWYELGEGDEWKKKEIISNLKPAIEIIKFKIVDNPN